MFVISHPFAQNPHGRIYTKFGTAVGVTCANFLAQAAPSTDFHPWWLKWRRLAQGCAFYGFRWYYSPFWEHCWLITRLRLRNPPFNPPSIFGLLIGVYKPNSKIVKISYYRNYCIDLNQILPNDRDPIRAEQIQDSGRPPFCKVH